MLTDHLKFPRNFRVEKKQSGTLTKNSDNAERLPNPVNPTTNLPGKPSVITIFFLGNWGKLVLGAPQVDGKLTNRNGATFQVLGFFFGP